MCSTDMGLMNTEIYGDTYLTDTSLMKWNATSGKENIHF